MDKNIVRYLDSLYPDLYKIYEKDHRTNIDKTDKFRLIEEYLNRLQNVHESAKESTSVKNLLFQMYCDRYVIKRENINGSEEEKDRIIKAQQESLKAWLTYLNDDNAKYPIWAKFMVFQGVVRIGTYNEANDVYMRRNKTTTAPFIEANPEVISKCIGLVRGYLEEEKESDTNLTTLIKNGNFNKLYTVLLKNAKEENFKRSGFEGLWVEYHYGSEEDAIKLYESLQGYNTGWCTAGDKQTAINQVCGGGGYPGGNFYVYYTKDENNEYKIPRIAIRMDGMNNIGEIRGVADSSQNMEEGFEDILEEKLNSMEIDEYDKNKYMSAVKDARELTKLNQKVANNVPFTAQEQRFIFEVDNKINYFGWGDDPRKKEIQDHVLITDYDVALEATTQDGWVLKYVSEEVKKAHPEIVLEAVKENGLALQCVSEDMQKAYPEIVLAAIREDAEVLEYVSKDVQKAHPEIVLEAVKQIGWVLRDVSEEVKKAHPEIVLEAVKQDGRALYSVSEDMQKDHSEIVLAAIREDAEALRYVSEEVKKAHPEIVLEAVKQNGWVVRYVSEEVKKAHPEIVLEAVRKSGLALRYVSEEVKKAHPEIAIEAVKQNGWALECVSEEVKKAHPEIVLEAVKQNGWALACVSEEVKKAHPEILLEAVKQYGLVLRYVSEEVKKAHPEIVLEAVKENGLALQCVSEDMQKAYPEIVLAAIREDAEALEYVRKDVQKAHPEIVLEAVKQNGRALEYVSEEVKKAHPEIVLEAVKQDGWVLKYVSEEIKKLILKSAKEFTDVKNSSEEQTNNIGAEDNSIVDKKNNIHDNINMIKEIEEKHPRGKNIDETEEDYVEYLRQFYKENNSNYRYIENVLQYSKEHNISIFEYFVNVAKYYRGDGEIDLPEFEFDNPFLTDTDISSLIESNEPCIPLYFASTYTKIIEKIIPEFIKKEFKDQFMDINKKNSEEILSGKKR